MNNKKVVESKDLKQGLGFKGTHGKAGKQKKIKKLEKEDLVPKK